MATRRRGRRSRRPDPIAPDPFEDDRGLAKRKLRQLCRQVERVLTTALGEDEALLDLRIEGVLPWPNASRLLVAVAPSAPDAEIDRSDILARLAGARPQLRAVAAAAIHRKRAPDLTFEVLLGFDLMEALPDTPRP